MTRPTGGPPARDESARAGPGPRWRHYLWLLAAAVFAVLYLLLPATSPGPHETLNYSQFLARVAAKDIRTVTIGSNGQVNGVLSDGRTYSAVVPEQAGEELLTKLEAAHVEITATVPGVPFGAQVLSWLLLLLPVVFIGFLWSRMSRGSTGRLQGVLGVGRSRAKVFDAERPATTFADVAGYDGVKLEIREVVDFLGQAEWYARAGAKAPRGVLMVGPPGTGKTLLARAVAGEAGVPFFSVTGSSFVEMFVGVGAARVRDLFAEARKRAPTIVFVDEIDAIGQRRSGTGAMVANDEREQTLNQLLSEMDGFEPATGIVVLAATNRPEVLDPALLRPGRFDRQVTIPLPNLGERRAILDVHCRGKTLDHEVDLDIVARGTPGFSGADLANLANEAAINAVRAGRDVLGQDDFTDARDRIILGRREGSNVLLPEEKRAVAVHEAGHALAAVYSTTADPVAKVTILPAGQALGATEQLPAVERHMYGEDHLYDMLTVMLGGRAGEVVLLGQASTGAANDLARATELATKMVREFGLSPRLGPVGYPAGGSVFLGGGGAALSSRPFAEQTQAAMDDEVARLVKEAERRATDTLERHRDVYERLVALLLERETVDGNEVYALAGQPVRPGRSTVAPQDALDLTERHGPAHPPLWPVPGSPRNVPGPQGAGGPS